jgi:hypothetical protein
LDFIQEVIFQHGWRQFGLHTESACPARMETIWTSYRKCLSSKDGDNLDFIQEVLVQQGWRQFAFGFLADCVRFEFFRGSRSENQIEFTRSGLISGGAGWTRLLQLLQQSDEMLGLKVTTTVEGWLHWEIYWLGVGATSSAFVAASDDGTVPSAVCKIYTCGGDGEAVNSRD